MSRLFFAVCLTPEQSAAIGSFQAKLGRATIAAQLRFVESGQAHYTLHFLGEQSAERRAAAVRAGLEAAGAMRAFDLLPQGLGVFPDEHRAHTLWMAADRGATELVRLAEALEGALVREGFSAEERPFVPHMTLARVKGKAPFDSIRSLLKTEPVAIPALRVDAFMLMDSESTSHGSHYVVLERFGLKGAPQGPPPA